MHFPAQCLYISAQSVEKKTAISVSVWRIFASFVDNETGRDVGCEDYLGVVEFASDSAQ